MCGILASKSDSRPKCIVWSHHIAAKVSPSAPIDVGRLVMQFISRPFVVGDRIEISSVGGSKFVVGVVERVDPMRTIIRTDACMPITIPNKVTTGARWQIVPLSVNTVTI